MACFRTAADFVYPAQTQFATHAYLRNWYCSGRKRGQYSCACHGIFAKSPPLKNIALPHRAARRSFVARDQALAAAIPAAHDAACEFRACDKQDASAAVRYLLGLRDFNKGGTAVDLTLRLNVLAVCAVFAFVGAILLGAF
jgi:hypothetical protein